MNGIEKRKPKQNRTSTKIIKQKFQKEAIKRRAIVKYFVNIKESLIKSEESINPKVLISKLKA